MQLTPCSRKTYTTVVPSCLFILAVIAGVASAAPFYVTIDTSAIAGSDAQLAFDFIDGGLPSNSLTISGFTTDGVLGSETTTGDVSGDLATSFMLSDASFFNEALYGITLGTTSSFVFQVTNNPPDASSFPDTFSFFVLNPLSHLPLFATTDPTGADAIFTFEITDSPSGTLTAFSIPGGEVTVSVTPGGPTEVPEPSTALLLFGGLVSMIAARRRLQT